MNAPLCPRIGCGQRMTIEVIARSGRIIGWQCALCGEVEGRVQLSKVADAYASYQERKLLRPKRKVKRT